MYHCLKIVVTYVTVNIAANRTVTGQELCVINVTSSLSQAT